MKPSKKLKLRMWQPKINGKRKTIRLGRIGQEAARAFMENGRALIALHKRSKNPALPPHLIHWLADLDDDTHATLVEWGIAPPRQAKPTAGDKTLGAFLEQMIDLARPHLKDSSIERIEYTRDMLVRHFGKMRPIAEITRGAASGWYAWLQSPKPKKSQDQDGAGLALPTAHMHIRNAKRFWNLAIDHEVLPEGSNPFRKIKSAAIAGDATRFYVPEADALKILEQLPGAEMKLIFALARWAALRTPSESHSLTWQDVNFEAGRLTVYSPKLHRKVGGSREAATRLVPIVPIVAELLQQAFDDAPEGATTIITLHRNAHHPALAAAIQAAGVKPWPKLWQNLRVSCETDWKRDVPAYIAAEWTGHDLSVQQKHYTVVPEDYYSLVTRPKRAAQSAVTPPGKSPQSVARSENAGTENHSDPAEIPEFATPCENSREHPEEVGSGLMSPSLLPLSYGANPSGGKDLRPPAPHTTESRAADALHFDPVSAMAAACPWLPADALAEIRHIVDVHRPT